jgi:hypothetical protein
METNRKDRQRRLRVRGTCPGYLSISEILRDPSGHHPAPAHVQKQGEDKEGNKDPEIKVRGTFPARLHHTLLLWAS